MSILPMRRRQLLAAGLALPFAAARSAESEALPLLREGGVVIAFRHALAPGVYDPPQFKLGDCSTQRNLNDEGRAQARRIGAWFTTRALVPSRVQSSPWCRCMDTASLAFGKAQAWPALGSPRMGSDAKNQAALRDLQRAVVAAPAGGFEVWVTHQFVLSALVGGSARSGDGLVLRADANRAPQVLAQLLVD